jgi:hypothetical protein
MTKNLNRTDKDNLQLNPITEHIWLDYYQKLWTKQVNDNNTEGKRAKLTENCFDLITMEKLETTVKALKSRKDPGSDGINKELYKHATKRFLHTWVISKVLHTVCFLFKNEFILQNTFTSLQCNLHCALSQRSNVWESLVFLSGRLRY